MMRWGDVAQGGGIVPAVGGTERCFWGVLSEGGKFLVVGSGIRDVLGWAVAETIGKPVFSLIVDEGGGKRVMEEWMNRGGDEILKVKCEMVGNDGRRRPVEIVLYRSRERSSAPSIIIQVKAWGSTTTQDIPYPHDADVFEELDTSRGSSWQYELQQLKFANQRLYEELEALKLDRLREDTPSSSFPERIRQVLPVARVGGDHCDWGTTPELREYEGQRSLKRPWGEI